MTKACYKCYSDVSRPYCMSCLLLKQCAQGDMPCQMQKVSTPASLHQRGDLDTKHLGAALARSPHLALMCLLGSDCLGLQSVLADQRPRNVRTQAMRHCEVLAIRHSG